MPAFELADIPDDWEIELSQDFVDYLHACIQINGYYMVGVSGKNRLASSPLTVGWLAKDSSPHLMHA